MRSFLLLLLYMAAVVLLHILLFSGWPASRYIINLAIILVIAVTLHRGLLVGVAASLFVGLTETYLSAISGPAHVLALALMSLATWFISSKLFTTRSTVSLLFTTQLATVFYAGSFWLVELLTSLLVRERITAAFPQLWLAALVTMFTHPFFMFLLWRWRGWDRYSQLLHPYPR